MPRQMQLSLLELGKKETPEEAAPWTQHGIKLPVKPAEEREECFT